MEKLTSPPIKSLVSHALNLKISPPLRSLSERRQLLSHLRTQFGDVLVYKSLYYDHTLNAPDSALVIFRDASASDALQSKRTVEFKLKRRPFAPDPPRPSMQTVLREIREPGSSRKLKSEGEEGLEADPPGTVDLPITVQAETWKGKHRGYLERTPFWGSFKIVPSMVQKHLENRVPLPGLSEINMFKPAQPLGFLLRNSKNLAKQKTLMEMYEDGLAKKTAEEKRAD
jgi:hypothetical protein